VQEPALGLALELEQVQVLAQEQALAARLAVALVGLLEVARV
jgi:hypothetical protein